MIVAQGLTKRYGDKLAVEDLSFEVRPGVVTGFLGPNGAGKSTTLRMINDIFAPDAGEIVVLDGLPPGREAAQLSRELATIDCAVPEMPVNALMGAGLLLLAASAKRRAKRRKIAA